MSSDIENKQQNLETFREGLQKVTEGLGFAAMSMAAVLSLVDLHDGRIRKETLALQPAYVVAAPENETANRGDEFMRRERDESTHSTVSYGVTMRSHPTAGKQ